MGRMTIGKKLDKLCEMREWKPADLARKIGTSNGTVSAWFNDESKPSLDYALRLSGALKVSMEYLADDSMEEPPLVITEDEKAVLDAFHLSGLSRREAMARLFPRPRPDDEGSFSHGVESPTSTPVKRKA
jgi:transcriptional regulator with XRE-family HTH domain